MPPHCDAMDGPVVKAAMQALEAGDVRAVLPYVHREGEAEVTAAFKRALPLRRDGPQAREVADLYFFETAVRVHRAGEGAPYTGLKPAGLDVGPAIPAAERAMESGAADELLELLTGVLRTELQRRLDRIAELRPPPGAGVDELRAYVQASLGLQVYSHTVYECLKREPHGGHEA